MTSNASLVGASMLLVVLLAVLGYLIAQGVQPAPQASTGIANPASSNCISLGGTLEIADEPAGQVGYCHLPDGRVCEEWSLMRGGCESPR